MFKKTSWLIIMVMALSVLAAGCGQKQKSAATDNSLQAIKDKGTIVLGLDDAFPPMGFRGSNNEIVGFDIDLAKEVAKRLGVKLEAKPISWDAKNMELDKGNIDVIWNGLTITPERQKEMLFSKPYLDNRQIIIVKADSAIDKKADLKGKKVGVQLDSSSQTAVQGDKATSSTFNELVKYKDNQTALMDLGTGRIDAVVADEILGRYIIAKKPGEFKVATENFGTESYGVGFRLKDKAFQAEVDKVLDEMKADGTAAEISKKWFGEDIVVK